MLADTKSQVSPSPHSMRQAGACVEGEPGTSSLAALSPATLIHRTLSPARLGQIVAGIVAAEHTWRPIVEFSEDHRWYRRLVLSDDHEIWLLSWLPGQHTGFHDHGEARGAFALAPGELRATLA